MDSEVCDTNLNIDCTYYATEFEGIEFPAVFENVRGVIVKRFGFRGANACVHK